MSGWLYYCSVVGCSSDWAWLVIASAVLTALAGAGLLYWLHRRWDR